MKKTLLLAGAFVAALAMPSGAAHAAGEYLKPPLQDWSFSGPFGTFDREQLQRGFLVFRQACSSCHGLEYVSFRNLAEPGGPEFSTGQVEAFAAEFRIPDGPDASGEMFERPGELSDRWISPFRNEREAAAANGGKAPPDLSVMAKARTFERGFPGSSPRHVHSKYNENGVDYIGRFPARGFEEPPAGYGNRRPKPLTAYYPARIVAMPNVLFDGGIIPTPGWWPTARCAPKTVEQYAKGRDHVSLMWTAEPQSGAAASASAFQVCCS